MNMEAEICLLLMQRVVIRMKLFILVLSLAFLLCACTPQEPVQTDPTQNTTAPSESVSPTETEPTDPPTQPPTEAPTDPTPSLLRPDAWYTAPLTFEDYFAEDRVYPSSQTRWLAETDSGHILYQLQLYNGKATLSQLCYDRGKLCLVDGTTVMEIDVPKLQYRTVLEHPQIQKIYFIDKEELRIEIYAGLCELDYHYFPATGKVTEGLPLL